MRTNRLFIQSVLWQGTRPHHLHLVETGSQAEEGSFVVGREAFRWLCWVATGLGKFMGLVSGAYTIHPLLCSLLRSADIALFTNERFVATVHWASAIFPTLFAHFWSLCHILVIFAIFQMFSLWYLLWWHVTSDLWCYCWNCFNIFNNKVFLN